MILSNRRVLYISYNGMLDPLGQSQVIPYLKELSRAGVEFTLLSFERAEAYTPEGLGRCAALRRELAESRIEWHWLRYHKTPSVPATFYDVWAGLRYAGRLVRSKQIEMVHARSQIPGAIALRLKRRFGVKMIFDVRGLMAEEYVDAGHWRKGSLPYRITKAEEGRGLAAADGVVTLTEKIWPLINQWNSLQNRDVAHEVVPCCADLELFSFSQEQRERRRAELRVQDRFVVVYSGSIDGWYLTEAMADFFVTMRKSTANAHLLWLTPTRHERLLHLMEARGLGATDYTVLASTPRDMPSYLSAADAGLAFIKPCFSKLASSPTKYAEYLGCGLPLIINQGVGDSDLLVTREKAGALVRDFNEAEYAKAAAVVADLAADAEQTRRQTRAVAERLFDVRRTGAEAYVRLYRKVLNNTKMSGRL
jgi:glycosyltransferase involved in cell wall biosynthesis